MTEREKLISDLDGADLFLRNRANAKPAPLNEYDKEALLDIAEIADKAARMLETAIIAPCNIGDKVYVITRCRCGNPENYELRACGKKVVAKTPKVLSRIMKQETGKRLKPNYTGKIEYEVAPKGTICYSIYEKQFKLEMLTQIGKTVFLTLEEAEQQLHLLGIVDERGA